VALKGTIFSICVAIGTTVQNVEYSIHFETVYIIICFARYMIYGVVQATELDFWGKRVYRKEVRVWKNKQNWKGVGRAG